MAYFIIKLLLYLSYLVMFQFMYVGSSSNPSQAEHTVPPIDCTFQCSDSRCFRQLFECLSDSFRRDVSRLTLAMTSQLLQCTKQLEKMNTQLSDLVNVTSEHLSAMVHSIKAEVAVIDKSTKATQQKLDRVKQLLSSRSVSDSSVESHKIRHSHRNFEGEAVTMNHHHQLHPRVDEYQRVHVSSSGVIPSFPHLLQQSSDLSDHPPAHHRQFSDVYSVEDSRGQSLDLGRYQPARVYIPYPVYEIRTIDPESSHLVKCYLCDGSERQYLIRTHNRWKRA